MTWRTLLQPLRQYGSIREFIKDAGPRKDGEKQNSLIINFNNVVDEI